MTSDYKLGIIGYPLGHSLSPQLHLRLLKATGLSGEYRPYEIAPERLTTELDQLFQNGISGLNVTIPHKISVMPLLDEVHPHAVLTGAVNTITLTSDGKKLGHNTDYIGFIRSLPDDIVSRLPESSILVLGAGGSARAILTALIQLGTASITFAVRDPEKALPILAHAETIKQAYQADSSIHVIALESLPSLEGYQGVINTTPIGMWPNAGDTPLAAIQLEALPPGSFVYDLIYRPLETVLIQQAQTLGLMAIGGLDMLIYQGIAAFELWTRATVPLDTLPELRQTLAAALTHPA